MKSLPYLAIVLVVVLALGVGQARAQEFKWVRGTITAVTAGTLNINVAGLGLNLAFDVGQDSIVVTGAHIYDRPPEKPTPPTLKQAVRVGEEVEVHYERRGDRNYAAVVSASTRQRPEAGRSVLGTLTANAPNRITVEADQRSHTFDLQPGARVVGPPATTGGKLPRVDALPAGTKALVLYRTESGRDVAIEIHPLRESR